MEKNRYQRYIDLLKTNKNLILTGAPGTGKSYMAKEIAKEMKAEVAFVQFHPSYDYTDFVEGLRPTPPDNNGNIGFERTDGVFKEFCKRALSKKEVTNNKPSSSINKENVYDYRNAITRNNTNKFSEAIQAFKQDLKHRTIDIKSFRSDKIVKACLNEKGNIANKNTKNWNMSDNHLMKYLTDGTYSKNDTYTKTIGDYIIEHYINIKTPKPFVFIIDEINRGEISKIFGELFFSIEPSYRGNKVQVKTQYQNMITDESDPFFKGFYVPENVYIIGTMNDIDRSVESMDFAMRRRFAWQEIKAADNTAMLDDVFKDFSDAEALKDEVVVKMLRLNNAIWNEEQNSGIDGLSPAYHIGGAYFCKLKDYLNEDADRDEAYGRLWENHLRGVLFEYLRGTANAVENMRKLKAAYDND